MLNKIKGLILENKNPGQTVAKNTFWLFTGESLGRLIKLGLIVYAARELGAGGWGIFAYALSVASLLMIFSDIGIENLIAREISQKKDNYKMFISAAFLLKSIILIISIVLVIFVSPHISNITEARGLFFTIAFIFFFDVIRNMGFAINRVMEKMEREMMTKVIMNFVILGLGIKPVSLIALYSLCDGKRHGRLINPVFHSKKNNRIYYENKYGNRKTCPKNRSAVCRHILGWKYYGQYRHIHAWHMESSRRYRPLCDSSKIFSIYYNHPINDCLRIIPFNGQTG